MEEKLIKFKDKMISAKIGPNGVPIIKATAEEIKRPDGSVDVVVHVPCLKIISKGKEI